MDSSVINEEPVEDEESSIQESSHKLLHRNRPRTQLNSHMDQLMEEPEYEEQEEMDLEDLDQIEDHYGGNEDEQEYENNNGG